jgi:hypothetical protein
MNGGARESRLVSTQRRYTVGMSNDRNEECHNKCLSLKAKLFMLENNSTIRGN